MKEKLTEKCIHLTDLDLRSSAVRQNIKLKRMQFFWRDSLKPNQIRFPRYRQFLNGIFRSQWKADKKWRKKRLKEIRNSMRKVRREKFKTNENVHRNRKTSLPLLDINRHEIVHFRLAYTNTSFERGKKMHFANIIAANSQLFASFFFASLSSLLKN